jgi:hypothetical protein
MLNTLRRIIGGEVRPVDLWLTIIEILVLLLIAIEVGWAMKDRFVAWRKRTSYQRKIAARLGSLNPEEAEALKAMLIEGSQPGLTITGRPALAGFLERDFVGWHVRAEYVEVLREWAERLTQ